MKIIFLDIDGVLNDHIPKTKDWYNNILQVKLSILNKIITASGARVYIISSWIENFYGVTETLEDILYFHGLDPGCIIGFRRNGEVKPEGIERALRELQPEAFVIIDDSDNTVDNALIKQYHVKPSSLIGLEEKHINQCMNILGYDTN